MKPNNFFLKTYRKYNIVFVKGDGKYIYDNKGNKYLDFFSGLSVCNLGYKDKKLVDTLIHQAKLIWHCSNLFYSLPQQKLAELIVEKTFPAAKANECAIKLVRKYGSKTNRYEIITFKNSFHGRTIATLSATGQKKVQKGFEPLLKGFKYAKFNDINSVKKMVNKHTVAIMIEPIQGEGGVIPAEQEFLKELRKLCDKKNLVLIFDEIQTGFGRTGEFFAYQYYKVKPDIITLAKSIANGMPLGATVVDKKYADVFDYGDHGSTFGGNLLACSVAVEVIKKINDKLLSHVKNVGEYFYDKLAELKNKYKFVNSVRGVGLMLGMELNFPCRNVVEKCLQNGLVINVTQEKVLRFLPPIIIEKSDVDNAVKILDNVLSEI